MEPSNITNSTPSRSYSSESVIVMPRPSLQHRRASEAYSRKLSSPGWQDDPALRGELEKIYAEWGLDTRWLYRNHRARIGRGAVGVLIESSASPNCSQDSPTVNSGVDSLPYTQVTAFEKPTPSPICFVLGSGLDVA